MLTDKQVVEMVDHDLGEAAWRLAPYLKEQGIRDAVIVLAFHQPSDLPFMVLFNPDGPILGFSPYVPQADTLLRQEILQNGLGPTEALLEWANRQRWDIVARRRITYRKGQANGQRHDARRSR